MRVVSILALALALVLGGLVSCSSPTLGTTSTGVPVAANEARLDFRFGTQGRTVDYGYSVADAGYLVVLLRSESATPDRRFAAVPVVAGSATVSLPGLPAGNWSVEARLFDWDGTSGNAWSGSSNPSQPTLLFTGRQVVAIQTGTSTNVNLLLYKPGSVGTLTLTEATPVDTVQVSDGTAGISHRLVAEKTLQLYAQGLSASNGPASETRFRWVSDHPDIAEVNAAGLVTLRGEGKAVVTAVSVEGDVTGVAKSATYTLWVEPSVYGSWYTNSGGNRTYVNVWRDAQDALRFDQLVIGVSNTVQRSRGTLVRLTEGWSAVSSEFFDFTAPELGWQRRTGVSQQLQVDGLDRLTIQSSQTLVRQGAWVPTTGLTLSVAANPSPNETEMGLLSALPSTAGGNASWPMAWFTSTSAAQVGVLGGGVHYLTQGTASFTARSLDDPTLTASVSVPVAALAGGAPKASVVPTVSYDVGYTAAFYHVMADQADPTRWYVSGQQGNNGAAALYRFTDSGTIDTTFAVGTGYKATKDDGNHQTYFFRGQGTFQVPSDPNIYLTSYFQNGYGNSQVDAYNASGILQGSRLQSMQVPFARPVPDGVGDAYYLGWYDGPISLAKIPKGGGTPSVLAVLNGMNPMALTTIGNKIFVADGTNSGVGMFDTSGNQIKLSWFNLTIRSVNQNVTIKAIVDGGGGHPLVAGTVASDEWDGSAYVTVNRGVVIRLAKDGSLPMVGTDDFGGTDPVLGRTSVTILPHPFDYPQALSVQPDGKIVVVGISAGNNSFALRLTADGKSTDPTFASTLGRHGSALLLGSAPTTANSVAVNGAGSILVVGSDTNGGLQAPAVWKF